MPKYLKELNISPLNPNENPSNEFPDDPELFSQIEKLAEESRKKREEIKKAVDRIASYDVTFLFFII